MNLGQTLVAILALVLLVTIAVNINRARIGSIASTVDGLVDQEAINFGQTVLERVSQRAQTDTEYNALESFHGEVIDETFGSGRTLYALTEVELITGSDLPYNYKKVTVSVYADSTLNNIRSQYSASLIPWWRYSWD